MRIAQVTFGYLPLRGGGDVYAEQLRRALEARGHQVVVYQASGGLRAPQVRPLWVPPGLSAGRRFWWLTVAVAMRAPEMARYHRLIVHYPPYLLPLLWHPGLIGLSHGVMWDDAPHSLTGRLKKRIARWAFQWAPRFVANDTFFLREMGHPIPPAQGFGEEVAPGRWFLPNTFDRRLLRPPPPNPALQSLHPLLLPRNLYRNRGIHLAVEAFAAFHREHPETHLLILGGEGQAEYALQVRRLVSRLGLEESVLFRGSVPWQEMGIYYASAEMTLIPSLAGEGTSLAALESMACGTATLMTAVGGLLDLPGPHVPPTAEGILEGLRRMYPHRREWGIWQCRHVLRHFHPDRWEAVWQRVVEERPWVSSSRWS